MIMKKELFKGQYKAYFLLRFILHSNLIPAFDTLQDEGFVLVQPTLSSFQTASFNTFQ